MQAVTFTRASNATFVGSDGKLNTFFNVTNVNLLSASQAESFATTWTASNASVVANATYAPNKFLNASKFVENTATASHELQIGAGFSATGSTSYTYSLHAKASDRSFCKLQLNSIGGATGRASGVFCNLDTLATLISVDAGGGFSSVSVNATDQGDGWVRISLTVTTDADHTGLRPYIYLATSLSVQNYAGNGTAGVFLWGAQLEVGSTATEYFPTNINQPRFDWASTAQIAYRNLLQQSEAFNNSPWQATVAGTGVVPVITDNYATAPDGTNTATRIQFDLGATTSTAFSRMIQGTSALSQSQTTVASTYLKTNDGSTKTLYFLSGAGTVFKSITVTADWQRFSGTFITFNPQIQFGLSGASSAVGITTSTTADILAWGAQLEIGSAPTDYQPVSYTTTNTPLTANPTSNGLLIEESRTNRLLWNRDATQANWVSTNITAAKDQTGIDGVASAASSLTATSADGTCIQTITLASGSRTGSVYLKRITGTGTVQVSLDGSTYSTVDLSDTEWRRIVL
jgi:hypothetical protein